jgi:hypothetical protein
MWIQTSQTERRREDERTRGREDWKDQEEKLHSNSQQKGNYDLWLTPKFSTIARGARLTQERVERMIVGDSQEKNLMLEMLYNREAALAWDFNEIGCVKDSVAPSQEIRTVPHKVWQTPSFPVPRALQKTVIEMLKERLR